MKILKDRHIVEDTWSHISDLEEISAGDITLSLARWKNESIKSFKHQGNTGIRLSPADNVEEIANDLANINLVALEFPAFTDGRSFSQARLLRSRYNFKGEIRAMGNFMPDQVFYLSRVGINSFQLENTAELDVALSTMNDFTVQYQASTN